MDLRVWITKQESGRELTKAREWFCPSVKRSFDDRLWVCPAPETDGCWGTLITGQQVNAEAALQLNMCVYLSCPNVIFKCWRFISHRIWCESSASSGKYEQHHADKSAALFPLVKVLLNNWTSLERLLCCIQSPYSSVNITAVHTHVWSLMDVVFQVTNSRKWKPHSLCWFVKMI